MTAMTVESAKDIGIGVVVALIALMLVMAWLVKTVTTKLISVLVVGGLALGVWTQRSSLENCARKLNDSGALAENNDSTCSFLGADIKTPAPTPP
jgi:hypothetical protein